MIQKLKDIHFTSNLHFRNKDVAITRGLVHLHGGKLDSHVGVKRINVSYDQEMKLYTAEDILHRITQQ